MKIMQEYTYNHLIKNKRHSISILIAITIASTLLCSLCIYGHTLWKMRKDAVISRQGYWHGELWNEVRGDQLKYVTQNPEVETTLIKGQWVTAKLTATKRPYLLLRDADENYWRDMSEKNALMEGKLPSQAGEIVLSKLFFDDNGSYKIGDRVTLPIGKRMLEDTEVPTQSVKIEGESFQQLGEQTYTIVGKLDITGISAYPGYIAMGYLQRESIKPDDGLTVYMRFVNPRKIYKVLPQIAQAVGFEKDEYGQYEIRYNASLLSLYGITDTFEVRNLIEQFAIGIIVALVIAAFVLIIYNAFSLSANARIKQLGILKSLGATPKQIKHSVLYEAIVLCIIPIPIGIVFGYWFSQSMVSLVNGILSNLDDFTPVTVSFSWAVVAVAVVMSFVTVIISALIPARQVSKLFSIEAIQGQKQSVKVKMEKNYPMICKVLGVEGELAMITFAAYKKRFRTAVISLSMCFLMLSGFICTIWIVNYSNALNQKTLHYDMNLRLNISQPPSDEMINKIRNLEEVEESALIRTTSSTTYVTSQQEAKEFADIGGFASVDTNRFNVLEQQGKYRIAANLLGLDDATFRAYCNQTGANPSEYYNSGLIGIVINKAYTDVDKADRHQKTIPMLNTRIGDSFILNEKTSEDMKTQHQFNMTAGYITDVSPDIDLNFNKYGIVFVVPMETYEKIVSEFMPERAVAYQRLNIKLLVGDEDSSVVKQKIEQICDSYFGSEDFDVTSKVEKEKSRALVQQALGVVLTGVSLLLGFIGVSNAYTTISNSLKLRRREISMLRSAGLTPAGLNKMLVLEGLFFGFKPIAISIPGLIMICWFMMWTVNMTWMEFLPNFPLRQVGAYAVLIIAVIWGAYIISATNILRDNIVDAIKDETV